MEGCRKTQEVEEGSKRSVMDLARKIEKFSDKVDYLEIRIVKEVSQSIVLEDSKLIENSISRNLLYGVRIIKDGKLGFSSSNDLKRIGDVILRAIKLSKLASTRIQIPEISNRARIKAKMKIDPFSVDEPRKIRFLKEFSSRLEGNFIKSRILSLSFSKGIAEFYSSFGSEIYEEFIKSGVKVICVGKKGEELQYSSYSRFRNMGFEFLKEIDIEHESEELCTKLNKLLNGRRIGGGKLDVICDNQLAGVFFHEALGHACEADSILSKESILKDKLNTQIGSKLLNICDDPSVDENGSYHFDDEGVRAKRKYIVKNGVLVNFLHCLETAGKLGVEPTGNGRAENPLFPPIPRMSNIVIEPGDWEVEELIRETKYGIYARDARGGSVNVTTGDFIFTTKEAYLIEKGEITHCIKDFSMLGNILNTLKNVVAIAKDSKPTYSGGVCGKKGQRVDVGEIAPHVKIRGVIVGSG
ncbi:MAG: TldD/PmbA family protein [Candidatus Nanoarchaeia archaeon]|nr:TldD/PmbA family protein [Candidatus Haiyanarchaeum thermophilum]MCW1303383.1 TldD/PmbA family protein [Candidatus Haiyanarchaeum thermophilum]MCW1303930.1 TldD/PmbA family protein [Candidatus Haiyanarchaeum thermophilum]MCW1306745.1 TldD/PmbA family protein [Candidatus Haiyanarchaeum thermophilum]MCW1307410.1 TldD/PmbA family protein [Candidatus Haiyanarchaeum thermophilum]